MRQDWIYLISFSMSGVGQGIPSTWLLSKHEDPQNGNLLYVFDCQKIFPRIKIWCRLQKNINYGTQSTHILNDKDCICIHEKQYQNLANQIGMMNNRGTYSASKSKAWQTDRRQSDPCTVALWFAGATKLTFAVTSRSIQHHRQRDYLFTCLCLAWLRDSNWCPLNKQSTCKTKCRCSQEKDSQIHFVLRRRWNTHKDGIPKTMEATEGFVPTQFQRIAALIRFPIMISR